jgi:glycosyltransferase involved in cell wall biosynthesis
VPSGETRPSLAIIKSGDYGAWQEGYRRGLHAGDIGPYGMRGLEQTGFRLLVSDGALHLPWRSPAIVRPLRKIGHLRPELSGLQGALSTLALIARADATLAVFEDQGLCAASAKARGLAPFSGRQLAIVSCWLAETCKELDGRTLGAVRRALAAVDVLFFFSANQAAVLEHELGVDPARLACVPFGIDHRFFSPRPVTGGPSSHGILAVGRDHSRDHALLIEAVRGTGMPLRLVGPEPGSLGDLPAEVELISQLDHRAYRAALAGAAVVAVPTVAPAYPSGQTVVLEAMSMGRPVVVTDSPAMRDYVTSGVNGELVPAGDAAALSRLLRELLEDPGRGERLGRAGRETVERRFNDRLMWEAVGGRLHEIMPRPRCVGS